MPLSGDWWKFWEGLSRGEIDWFFINRDAKSEEEKQKAIEKIIERGFVVAVPVEEDCGTNFLSCTEALI